MNAIPQMDVTLVFHEGTPEAYRLPIVASRDADGNLMAEMKEQDDNAHAYLNNNAETVLQQINAAFKGAGHEVPDDAGHILDLGAPIRKNDPRLSATFLTILVAAARTHMASDLWCNQYAGTQQFLRHVFFMAGMPMPEDSELDPFPAKDAESVDISPGGVADPKPKFPPNLTYAENEIVK